MNKTLMGVLSIAPGILFAIYMMMLMAGSENMGVLCILFLLIGVLAMLDVVLFIIFACKRTNWPLEKKIIWSIVLYSFNFLVFPVFWWLYMRED